MFKQVRPSRRGASVWLLSAAAMTLLLASACGERESPTGPSATPMPSATAPPPPAPPPPSTSFTRYSVSGTVEDEVGAPVPGAKVAVDYKRGSGGSSNPESVCFGSGTGLFCWLRTVTDVAGRYNVELEAEPDSRYPGHFGYVYTWHDGLEANIQLLPTGSATVVQHLRLRRIRALTAGESVTLSVEPDSSRCTDLEDLWVMTSRCEFVRIFVGAAGTLLVEARAADVEGPVPSVYWATTGNYAGIPQRPGPGAVSVPVRGGTYQMLIGIPAGLPARQFEVTTSLR